MKALAQRDARRLRGDNGMSIAEIARTLEVSKSSVSGWVRDVQSTTDQVAALLEANPALNRQMKGQATRARRARASLGDLPRRTAGRRRGMGIRFT